MGKTVKKLWMLHRGFSSWLTTEMNPTSNTRHMLADEIILVVVDSQDLPLVPSARM